MSDPTVFIVDDDPSVLDSLAALLGSTGMRSETYDSGRAFLDAYQPERNGCLLLDVKMPDMSGLELQARLAEELIHIPIIIMTGHGDVKMAVRAMKAGAVDFIEKPFNDGELIWSIRNALQVDAKTRNKEILSDKVGQNMARLTCREREILEYVAKGEPSKVIARELDISPRTVEIHRSRIMEKLEARNLSHLVRMALTAGILPS